MGACFNKSVNKFMAQIKVDNKNIYLGLHKTAQEAHEAYITAKRQFHPYGEL